MSKIYKPTIEDITYISNIDTLPPGKLDISFKMGKLSNMTPDKNVLVVSSHRGHQILLYKKEFGVNAVGLDIDENMIKVAQQRCGEFFQLTDEIKFVLGDSQNIPFEDNSFDIVTNEGAVGIPEDPEKVLNEMLRVLKPGGIVIFRESIFDNSLELEEKEELCQRYGTEPHTIKEWEGMLRNAGAKNIKNEVAEWSDPRLFWDVRHDRSVSTYNELYTLTEKMMTSKKVLKEYGKEGLLMAAENEKIFYDAILKNKISYGIFYGEK